MKKIFLIIMFLLFIPSKVYGFCSSEEKSRLINIAKNLDLTYDYYYNEKGKVRFKITITNLHPDIYIYDKEHFVNIYYDKNSNNPKEITIDEFLTGGSYSFVAYGNTPNCKGKLIMTQYKTVPAYNGYSQDPLCIGIEEYELCKKWKSVPISYEEFVRLVTAYKEVTVPEEVIVEEYDDELNYYIKVVIDFISKYYMYYVLALILTAVLVLLLRKKDTFKLE